MATSFESFDWTAKLAKVALIVLLGLSGVIAAYCAASAVLTALDDGEIMTVIWYALGAVAALAAAPALVTLYGLTISTLSADRSLRLTNDRLSRLEALQQAADNSLKRLADLAPLSDQAKAMIYREREIEALREIIHESLARQDYQQAEKLIDRMDQQFGYHEEAESFRAEVAANREATKEEQVLASIARVDRIIAENNWARALREAARLSTVYPDNPRIAELPQRVAQARSQHKRDLLTAYGEAVRVNDVDRSIELLKQLDTYLTPQEAAALTESARGVFRAKLHNLGVQFAIAVTDERWASAVETGQEIVRGFPNSRMAAEVREKLDALQQRAATSV